MQRSILFLTIAIVSVVIRPKWTVILGKYEYIERNIYKYAIVTVSNLDANEYEVDYDPEYPFPISQDMNVNFRFNVYFEFVKYEFDPTPDQRYCYSIDYIHIKHTRNNERTLHFVQIPCDVYFTNSGFISFAVELVDGTLKFRIYALGYDRKISKIITFYTLDGKPYPDKTFDEDILELQGVSKKTSNFELYLPDDEVIKIKDREFKSGVRSFYDRKYIIYGHYDEKRDVTIFSIVPNYYEICVDANI